MAALIKVCDLCGIETTFNKDFYDHIDYCEKCWLKNSIYRLKQDIEQKEKWLEETHLATLARWKKELEDLESQLRKVS